MAGGESSRRRLIAGAAVIARRGYAGRGLMRVLIRRCQRSSREQLAEVAPPKHADEGFRRVLVTVHDVLAIANALSRVAFERRGHHGDLGDARLYRYGR